MSSAGTLKNNKTKVDENRTHDTLYYPLLLSLDSVTLT